MRESTFVKLGLIGFGLVLLTFLVRGVIRIFFGDRVALLVVAPLGLAALVLLVVLVVQSFLSATKLRPLESE